MLSSNLVVWLEVKKSKKFINKVPIFACVPKLIYVTLQLTNIKVKNMTGLRYKLVLINLLYLN